MSGKKIPWPQAFGEGDIRGFLEDFGEVAEVVRVKAERGKLVAMWSLLVGNAEAVLKSLTVARDKVEWYTVKDASLKWFDLSADREEAMRQFRTRQLNFGADTLSYAVALQKLLSCALRELDEESTELILKAQFLEEVLTEFRLHTHVASVTAAESEANDRGSQSLATDVLTGRHGKCEPQRILLNWKSQSRSYE